MSETYKEEIRRRLKVCDDYSGLSDSVKRSVSTHGRVMKEWLENSGKGVIQYKESNDLGWTDCGDQSRPHFVGEIQYRIKPAVKKMTVNEIQDILGYDVEIVSNRFKDAGKE